MAAAEESSTRVDVAAAVVGEPCQVELGHDRVHPPERQRGVVTESVQGTIWRSRAPSIETRV